MTREDRTPTAMCFSPRKKKKKLFLNEETIRFLLTRIHEGKNLAEIAKLKGLTPPAITYHVSRLRQWGLVGKNGNRYSVTQKGSLIIKNLFRSGESSFNKAIVRLDKFALIFKVEQIPLTLNFDWSELKYGIKKAYIKEKKKHTIELIHSPNPNSSVIVIHLAKRFFEDYRGAEETMKALAIEIARDTAKRFGLKLLDSGIRCGKPEIAFVNDPVAKLIGPRRIVRMNTVNGEVRYDNSNGTGELETNDIEFACKYVKMIENFDRIYEYLTKVHSFMTNWRPAYSQNN